MSDWTNVTVTEGVSEILKCCPIGEAIGPDKTCVPSESDPSVICSPPKCRFIIRMANYCEFGRFVGAEGEPLIVTPSGLKLVAGDRSYTTPSYCLEDFLNSTIRSDGVYPIVCREDDRDDDNFVADPVTEKLVFEVFPFLLGFSALLLLVTLILYVTVIAPHSRSSMPQKGINIAYMSSFFGALTLLIWASLMDADYPLNHPTLCSINGFAVQFFFLATFFWLNVMCIDIYWAFSDLRSLGGAGGTWRDQKKLMCYSAYAWGMPLLILGVTIAVDLMPSVPTTSRFKPAMGLDKCFFRGRIAGWTYFYGPMAVILLMNCLLFAITAFHLYRHRRDACVLKRGDSRRHGPGSDKERFNLYLKLFLVMGINWLSEVVSFTFHKDVPKYLWYLTDITNTLQGVFIFLIFVWKRRLWHKDFRRRRQLRTASPGDTEPVDLGEVGLTDEKLIEDYLKMQPASIPDNSHEHDS
ncbi:hypothetical protein GE061_018113 [Apolygus lucorum]|uniref:G-protein coupled receptors family 2 profile 2 domain-containing protein n=1 Tax=Apolygus lucorum TaxID=248454 RepID=A0A8S9XCZ3_APOLU|nr:hypothetical protein GE061_018113 [Apolygus lucorum]